MYKNQKFLAIIPARGGSKGIPRKNIIDVAGKPLIAYTIESALSSRYLDRVIVSTDDVEIAEVSKQYGAEVPFLRPAYLATDEAKTIDTVIDTLERVDKTYDYVVLLQPTQPLRTAQQIDEAIQQVVEKNQSSLVSVEEAIDHPILYRKMTKEGELLHLLHQNSSVRRQDFEPYYKVNGLIYINKVDELNYNTSLNDNEYSFLTKQTIDIDTCNDIKEFIYLLKKIEE